MHWPFWTKIFERWKANTIIVSSLIAGPAVLCPPYYTYTKEALQSIPPLLLPTNPGSTRKPPTNCDLIVPDESIIFKNRDCGLLNDSLSPGSCIIEEEWWIQCDVLSYFYDNDSVVPYFESIKINTELNVQLFQKIAQFHPLPKCFKRLNNECKLTRPMSTFSIILFYTCIILYRNNLQSY